MASGVFGQEMAGLGGECLQMSDEIESLQKNSNEITDLLFGNDGYYFIRYK